MNDIQSPAVISGKASIVRALYEAAHGAEEFPVARDRLLAHLSAQAPGPAQLMDFSIILQALGQSEHASVQQEAAIGQCRAYRIRNSTPPALTMLAFVTAGDFMANTPVEFLLEGSDVEIILYYVDRATEDLRNVPPHDVVFVAIAESVANRLVLARLGTLLERWHCPVLNAETGRIIGLARESVPDTLADEPSVLSPQTALVSRGELNAISSGSARGVPSPSFPMIVRPAGTHAGKGLERMATGSDVEAYLHRHEGEHFYTAPFVDYAGSDRRYRKYRIAFIGGRAFPCHLAVSEHWMVHYLNADMAQHADRRAEEARWMEEFNVDFAVRHAIAFDALCRRIELDYFAIDCAETADGRLLVFEADVAMLVHSMDAAELFPYKKPAMRKLFHAFADLVRTRRLEWSDLLA